MSFVAARRSVNKAINFGVSTAANLLTLVAVLLCEWAAERVALKLWPDLTGPIDLTLQVLTWWACAVLVGITALDGWKTLRDAIREARS